MNKRGDFETFIVIFFILLAIAFLVFLVNLGMKKECKEEAKIMGVTWKYNFWIDCMVKVDGKWVKIDNYIINKEDKNGN